MTSWKTTNRLRVFPWLRIVGDPIRFEDLLVGFRSCLVHGLVGCRCLAEEWGDGCWLVVSVPESCFLLEVSWGHHPVRWMETFQTKKYIANIENSWRCFEVLLRPSTLTPFFPRAYHG